MWQAPQDVKMQRAAVPVVTPGTTPGATPATPKAEEGGEACQERGGH